MPPRRAKGMGSVQPHGHGWRIQYFVHGQRYRETFDTKDEAETKLLERLAQAKGGRFAGLGPDKITVGMLIDLVIEDYEFRKLRSLPVVKWRADAHVRKVFGKMLAAKCGTADIKRYVMKRRTEGAEDATINRELSIVRRGFKLGLQHDPPVIVRAPYVPKLEEDNARQGFLEQEQYERLLRELPERLKALFVCAYHVGTRKGELRKIQWSQVDFKAGLIHLRKAQTKAKKPRTLPIYGDMEQWLQRELDSRIPDCPWVFHHYGKPVGSQLRGWREACERAGMPELLFHDLRRSAVRNMKRAGVGDVEAMRISGHKTRSIFDRYNIVDEADLRGAADKMEKYMESQKSAKEPAACLRRVK